MAGRTSKRIVAAGIASAIVIGALALSNWRPWAATPPLPEVPAAKPRLFARPIAVASGIYLLGRTSPGAAYAVDTPAGLILVDSGLRAEPDEILVQLRELGLDIKRLVAILLTHIHADHSLGAARLRSLTGAKLYAGAADASLLRAGGPREAFFSIYRMPELSAHPTPVDVELAGDEVLPFGDVTITAVATPGHTPGSICYLLKRDSLRVLFAGDVVQSLDPARPDALGTYSAYLPPVFRGNAKGYAASLRRLRAMTPPNLVLPGHPQQDAYPQSPEISADRWHALLDGGIREMDRLQARYDADGADFLDGHPKEILPGLHYLGDHGGRAVFAINVAGQTILFDAPGGESLVPFLAGRKMPKPAAVVLTSGDAEAIAGLAAVIKDAGSKVIAPRQTHDSLRKILPPSAVLLGEEELAKLGLPGVEVIPLAGRGVAPVAYRFRWDGKVVLISGTIPVRVTVESGERLLRDAGAARADGYLDSLQRLRDPAPDVWLPAFPADGQNANLYDTDWVKVLAGNRKLLRE